MKPSVTRSYVTALHDLAPVGFDEQYAAGMRGWTDAAQADEVDKWLEQNEEKNDAFLWQLLEQNREMIDALLP
jgi:hypothetical protein